MFLGSLFFKLRYQNVSMILSVTDIKCAYYLVLIILMRLKISRLNFQILTISFENMKSLVLTTKLIQNPILLVTFNS